MRNIALAALALLALPAAALAAPVDHASFSAARSLLVASSTPGNAYLAGTTVTITAPIDGDLTAAGGTLVLAAPITGDALLLGGSIGVRAPIEGDFRAAGGSITVEKPISGDLVAVAASIDDKSGTARNVFIAALNVTMENGAQGPVTIYGNNVSLAGHFAGDVHIVGSGRITLAASTTINGALSYEAPETANIPGSAAIKGGVTFRNASYLPSAKTSRLLAFASIAIFILARIIGALILAGLLAGLFPRLGQAISRRAHESGMRRVFLTALLGFAALVATPVMIVLLLLTFIGIGIAILLLMTYALLILLAFLYAGILVGAIFARRVHHRETVLWHDGVLGMLALSVVALIPYLGAVIVFLLTIFCMGALLLMTFHFAFPHEDDTGNLLES